MKRGNRATVVWALVALLLVASVATALGSAVPAPSTRVVEEGVRTASGDMAISVTTTDSLRFMPSAIQVPAGQPISLSVTQGGVILHTFTLLSLVNYQAPPSTSNWSQLLHSHPAIVNLVINATAGQTQSKTLSAPKTGYYEFVCVEPGHFQGGMFGFLGVGVPPPNVGVPTGAGAPVYYTTALIAGLVILMVALGVVFGRRARPAAAPGATAPRPAQEPEPADAGTPDFRNRL